MFGFEEYLTITNSLVIVGVLLSCCAVWFAYRSYKISVETYKRQKQTENKRRERAKSKERGIKNQFYEAKSLALKTKKKGENIVRNINKHLLQRTPQHSGLVSISQSSIMRQANKDALFTIREEMVRSVAVIDRLIKQMSVDNFSDELVEKIKKYADKVDDRDDEVTEIFEENELVYSRMTGFSSFDEPPKTGSMF